MTHIEYDQWMRKDEETNDELVERLSTITKNKESSPKPKQEKKDYKQVFDDLFGDTVNDYRNSFRNISYNRIYIIWNLNTKTETLETWMESFSNSVYQIQSDLKDIDSRGHLKR